MEPRHPSAALSVEMLLGPGGALQSVLPGYEHRPQQLQLAHAVERALAERAYLLAEAGTGTGKTLAYLVPAVLSGRRVVVSTATKTLQDQIFLKDLPLLRERVGLRFEAAYLKGRSNYLCLYRYAAFAREPRFESREEARGWARVQGWAERTQSGERSELELPESYGVWSRLTATAETCLGSRCPLYESCFVTKARRWAEEADIVVVNHHLFFADLALKGEGRGEGVLPPYEAVVFDEAHALEDAAGGHFGCSVSSLRVEELVRDAQEALPAEDKRRELLVALAGRLKGQAERLLLRAPGLLGLSEAEGAVGLEPERLGRLGEELAEVREALAALAAFAAEGPEPELAALGRRGAELAEDMAFLERAESREHVYWAEQRGRGLFLRASPIEPGRELRERLYGAVDTVVFTSATLAAQGRFEYFAQRMGLYDEHGVPVTEVRALSVPSPFDYGQQAALYLPTHLPEPSAPGFVEAAAEEVIRLCEVTGGRAFVLFTSLRNMAQVHERVKWRLPCQVLVQGELPKAQLLEAFQSEPSVLLASQSFWEGVDVPGEALSLVIIDRLPFASPGDPVVAARMRQIEERGESPFDSYQLPQAALALRQGFGRLIRTQADRGVVALLDKRITTKRYGRFFLASLPPARRVQSLEALERWWAPSGRGPG